MRHLAAILLLLPACREDERVPAPAVTADAPGIPADTLVLALGEREVWFTAALPDTSAAGMPCVARAMEIRQGGRAIPVPLLYTTVTPDIIDDSTIRAPLMRDCAPVDVYAVNLRTGLPKRVAQ